jgi:hypothetical protein
MPAAYSTLDLALAVSAAFLAGVVLVGVFAVRLLLRRIRWLHELLDELTSAAADATARAAELRDDDR